MKTPAGAHARALVGALAVGSSMTFLLGGAYVAGGAARAAAERVPPAYLATAGGAPGAMARIAISNPGAGALGPIVPLATPELASAALVQPAAPFRASLSGRDFDCLATAVYYEARGEGAQGQQAVAQVVLNRVRHPSFPKSVCGVVFQGASAGRGCQFSFACDGSMRRRKETGAWDRARSTAAKVLAGAVLGEVGNATHFHARRVAPGWGNLVRVASVGSHVFYRFGGGGAGRSVGYRAVGKPAQAAVMAAQMAPNPGYTLLGPSSRDESVGLTLISAQGPERGDEADSPKPQPIKASDAVGTPLAVMEPKPVASEPAAPNPTAPAAAVQSPTAS